jgi:CBS domain containing-hemolysin-like protein
MEYLVPIAVIALLILFNGLFVAAEFAVVGASRTRIAQRAEQGSVVARRVLNILQNPDRQNRYLATAQVGITIASLGLGMYGEHAIAHWLVGPLESLGVFAVPVAHTISAVVAIGFLTYLHVVIGEMIPKSIALQSADNMVLQLERPMGLMDKIFRPIVVVLNGLGNTVVKLMGIRPASESARLMSPDELEMIVEESYQGGLIQADEHLFIENILDLSERTVGQVMSPRTRIIGIPVTATEKSVLKRACATRFTRLPIYEGGLDQIVGILHLKDLARQQMHPDEAFDLRRLARPAVFVPESLSLEDMLRRFRRENIQMAIVFDEYGGTAGLVTIEDLVEEVVGEILDEFDQEIAPMKQIRPGVLRVRGDLLLDELNQHYDLHLSHPDADTVGGLLMTLLGRVLRAGDEVVHEGARFEVEAVKGLAVQTVIVELPRKPDLSQVEQDEAQAAEAKRRSQLPPGMKEARDSG